MELGELNMMEADAEEASEVKGLPDVCMPCAAEVSQHNLTHLPFRDWCPYCAGKGGELSAFEEKERDQ